MSDKVCPLRASDCSASGCAWWSEQYQKCAVLLAAESIRKQVK